MMPKVAEAIITGTMARPSRPSVRLTALPAPTMTKPAKGRKSQPRSTIQPWMKGAASLVAGAAAVKGAAKAAKKSPRLATGPAAEAHIMK